MSIIQCLERSIKLILSARVIVITIGTWWSINGWREAAKKLKTYLAKTQNWWREKRSTKSHTCSCNVPFNYIYIERERNCRQETHEFSIYTWSSIQNHLLGKMSDIARVHKVDINQVEGLKYVKGLKVGHLYTKFLRFCWGFRV
jgi:hypothetical protein